MRKPLHLAVVLAAALTPLQAQFSFTSLQFPGADLTRAFALNNRGQIAGAYETGGPRHAVLINKGHFVKVDPFGELGTNWSQAHGINDRGDLVGTYRDSSGGQHGFLLTHHLLVDIDFPGGALPDAFGINDSGTIVGDFFDSAGVLHGFEWSGGYFTQIDVPGAVDTQPFGINARGDIVGSWDTDINTQGHGFVRTKDGTFVTFDAPNAAPESTSATGINDKDQIVGTYTDAAGVTHGFLAVGNQFTSVDFPGADVTICWGINNAGRIVGNYSAGALRAGFLATPTPPPAEFLYGTANGISSFGLSATGVPTSLQSLAGPNSSLGILVDPSARFLYVSDFANASVDAFAIASNGGLSAVAGSPFSAGSPPGAGGIAVDPATKFLYVTLLNASSVAAFSINSSSGALTAIPGSPFPAGNTPFQAIVDPSGKFLFVSNLNDQQGTISAYTIDSTSGALTQVPGSPFATQPNYPGPNSLAIGGGGKFLYVGMSGTANANHVVSAFSINSTTGALMQLASSPFAAGNDPLRITSDPAGKFLFTVNFLDNTVSAFSIEVNGNLTPVAGSPFAVLNLPDALAVDPTGGFLYVADSSGSGGDLSVFSINAVTGILTAIAGSPFSTGQQSITGLAIARGH